MYKLEGRISVVVANLRNTLATNFQQMIQNILINNMLDLTECHLAAHKILLNELNKFRFINIYIVLQEHINPSPAVGLGCLPDLLETSINIKDQSLYFFFFFS